MDCFADKILIDKSGERSRAQDVLGNKLTYILLFASSKCKGIEELLDTLKTVYNESFKHRCGFEVILISSEKTQADFDFFFQTMNGPWYALPFEEETALQSHAIEIRGRFAITYIPYIIVLKPDGTLVSKDAIKDLMTLGINVIVAWTD
ncbi:hypothetical protein WA026_013520 [Henosepilachna vigintioctopunctata]|uniref:protein-disulfide reductase n=1 Tax=Henosepilachna vigintioctopunctata TaxID=420089 RepID=A0AAW1V915_9CUCU